MRMARVFSSLLLCIIDFVLGGESTANHVSRRMVYEDDNEWYEQYIRLSSCTVYNNGNDDNLLRLSCSVGMTAVNDDVNDDIATWMSNLFYMRSLCEISVETDVMMCNVSQSYSGGGYSTTCSLSRLLAGDTTSWACTCDSSYKTYSDGYCWETRECATRTEESDECNECEVRQQCNCDFLPDHDDYHGLPSSADFWSELWQVITTYDDDGDDNYGSVQIEPSFNASQPSIQRQNIFWNMDAGRTCAYESGFRRPIGSRLDVLFVISVLVGMLVAFVVMSVRRRKIMNRNDSSEELLQEPTNVELPPIS